MVATLLILAPTPVSQAVAQAGRLAFGGDPLLPSVVVGPARAVPRWAAVAELIAGQLQAPPRALQPALAAVERMTDRSPRRVVAAIRRFVTRRVRYVEDRPSDHWSDPAATLSRGFGDCEDQAILGLYLALAAGLPPDRTAVAIGRDRRGNQHAVLLIEDAEGRLWLFDSADPGSPPLTRSGFSPRIIGFLDSVGFPSAERKLVP